jgi:hypothetical protein
MAGDDLANVDSDFCAMLKRIGKSLNGGHAVGNYLGVHWFVDIRDEGASRGERGHPILSEAFRPRPLV